MVLRNKIDNPKRTAVSKTPGRRSSSNLVEFPDASELEDFFDRCNMTLEFFTCSVSLNLSQCFVHRQDCGAQAVVGVDDHPYSGAFNLLRGNAIVCRRNDHQR